MTRRASGFTIIELVLVLVTLCILGGLIALTASGVQAKNRNGERQLDIDNLRAQLENGYAQTNTYPSFGQLANTEWRIKNLTKLKNESIADPQWTTLVTNCLTPDGKATMSKQPATHCYSYQVTAADGSPCDNLQTGCAHYTLTATLEGGEQYLKTSLN